MPTNPFPKKDSVELREWTLYYDLDNSIDKRCRPGFSVDGTFLKDIDKFDNVEFGISNKDAKALTLGTRKLVELSFRAMLDSGIDYRGKRFGSFMCGPATGYHELVSHSHVRS